MMKHFAGSRVSRGTYLAARRGVLCEKRCPGLYRREFCSGLVRTGDLSSAGPCDAVRLTAASVGLVRVLLAEGGDTGMRLR